MESFADGSFSGFVPPAIGCAYDRADRLHASCMNGSLDGNAGPRAFETRVFWIHAPSVLSFVPQY